MMKEMSKYVPAITVLSAIGAGTIAFFATQAVAEHNEKVEVHTVITQQIRDNAKDITAQQKVWVVMQVNNDKAHENMAKAQDRMILLLDRMEMKLDRTLANR